METSLYVALSGQIAAEKRMSTIADNIANVNTVGFRQTGVRFSEVVSGRANTKTSFVSPGLSKLSDKQGVLASTGSPFDFAINGPGWFKVETPAGEALTRDGRFQINAAGTLTNLDGYPVLDQGGSPVQINLNAGNLFADASGILHQQNGVVGSIGVFEADPPSETMRVGSLGFLPEGADAPAAEISTFSLSQGYTESSNVDAIEQITRLIGVQRTFEQVSGLMQKSEAALEEAIRILGGR